jgi:hypothetical protein
MLAFRCSESGKGCTSTTGVRYISESMLLDSRLLQGDDDNTTRGIITHYGIRDIRIAPNRDRCVPENGVMRARSKILQIY